MLKNQKNNLINFINNSQTRNIKLIGNNRYSHTSPKKYVFDNVLNPVKSAPIIAVVSDDNVCVPVPLYSDEQVQKIYNDKMVLLIK